MLTKAKITHFIIGLILLLSQEAHALQAVPQPKIRSDVYLLSATDTISHLENQRHLCHIPQLQEGKRQARMPVQQHSLNVMYSHTKLITIPFITHEYHDARKKLLSLVFFSTRLRRAPPARTHTYS